MSVPAGYIQIPSTGFLVKLSDGSGPYYLTDTGVPTAMPVSGGGGGGGNNYVQDGYVQDGYVD